MSLKINAREKHARKASGRLILLALASFCGIGVGSFSVSAQQSASGSGAPPAKQLVEHPQTIRAVAEEVLLDLVARDRRGRAVRDLKADEVEVFEDGIRQAITSFRLVEGIAPPTPVKEGTTPPETLRQINLVTLVFERLGDEGRKNARLAALEFLRTELPSNTFAAVFSNDLRLYVLQSFTNDRRRLGEAVEKATRASSAQLAAASAGVMLQLEHASVESELATRAALATAQANPAGSSTVMAFAEAKMAEITMRTIQVADILTREYEGRLSFSGLLSLVREQRRLPGRKTIIYFSEGLRVTPDLMVIFRSTISEANRSNVSVYCVDARGLITSEVSGVAHEILLGAESATPGISGSRDRRETSARTKVAGVSVFEAETRANVQDTLAELAASTGGFLTANTNEFGIAMRRIGEDIRGYYELTYRPPGREYDGKFHRISVGVLRPGVALQTRSGYYALPPMPGLQVFPFEVPMLAALQSAAPPSGLDYRAVALHFGYQPDGLMHALVMEVPLSNVTFIRDRREKVYHTHFSLLALVKDAEGRAVQKFSQDCPFEGPEERMEAVRSGSFTLTRTFRLPPGRYTLETSALDWGNRKAGVQRAVLMVAPPHGDLALSSVSVVGRVDPTQPGVEESESPFRFQNMTVTPNLGEPVRRAPGAGVPIYFVVYAPGQSGRRPEMELQLVRGGRVIASSPVGLPAPDAQGRIPFVATIPVESFEPGRYEVKALVRQGRTTAEEYAFFTVNP